MWPASSTRALSQGSFEKKKEVEATVCGTPIQFQANGKQSNATLGGIVKLIYEDGSFELKGLTAGHAAVECLEDKALTASISSDSSFEDENNDDDSSMDENLGSSNSDSEDVHLLGMGNEGGTQALPGQHNPWVFKNPSTIGEAFLADSILSALRGEPVEDGPVLDWALAPVSIFTMNRLPEAAYQQGSA